jgi:hypothetical protein
MTYTAEQLKTLSAWEENFRTAIKAKWARNPGRSGIRQIYDIYTKATGDRRRYSDNCSTCILSLLQDAGKLYFQDMETLRERESSSRAVKVSQEAKQVVKKASIKTKK